MADNVDNMKIGSEGKRNWLYVGDLKNGKRNGKGKMVWSHGAKYEGHFKEDMRDGMGTYYHSTGGKYEGNWANDMKNGKGVYIYPGSGEKYEG